MTSLYHVPFDFDAPLTSALMNEKLGQLDESLFNFASGLNAFNQINFGTGEGSGVVLTIATGVITISRTHHTVNVESGTTDDLDTINGGVKGDELILRLPTGSTNTIVVKHNTGNIFLAGETDVMLTSPNKAIRLFYNGAFWTDSAGGGGGALFRIKPRTALAAPAATMAITNIPNYYSHLRLIAEVRTDAAPLSPNYATLYFNGDTGANYYFGAATRDNSGGTDSPVAFVAAQTWLRMLVAPATSSPAGYYGVLDMTIYNYKATDRARHMSYTGWVNINDTASTMWILRGGGTWKNNTDAISTITMGIHTANGTQYEIGSSVTLYGML